MANKIRNLQWLSGMKSKVVLCHGVFDLLHIGHIRYLEQAKELGDTLIVTVTPDKYVNKGPNRPVFNENLRAEAIAALDCVDYVAINEWSTAVETIKLLKPAFYVKGSEYRDEDDYTGGISLEEESVISVGGKIAFTDDITFSSSGLINQHLLPQGTVDYLADFSSRYTAGDILQYLEGAKSLKVLVMGESIVDEYVYCEALGKSSKEPMLAMKHLYTEVFQGGIEAIVAHIEGFCETVHATPSNPIIKRRFIEEYFFTKLMEIYEFTNVSWGGDDPRWEEWIDNYDVVIVADYGHGMMTKKAIETLCKQRPFLAVNVQANAGNLGYNTISKYSRADYISLAENEAKLEARDANGDLREIVKGISQKLNCNRIAITRGKNGSLCYDGSFYEVPAVATKVVDRMGAGDAFLAITALCVAQGAPMEVVGFIGNAVGAMQVATVGHRKPVGCAELFRYVETLLK